MKPINLGAYPPDFIFTDIGNKTFRLSDFKGKKILLTFFRGAPCPFCNLRVHELIKNYQDFESNGLVVITLFAASAEEIRNYAGKQLAPFPIVPDEKLKIYKLYNIEYSFFGMLKSMFQFKKLFNIMKNGFFNLKSMSERPMLPADFLIDSNFKISKIHYGKDFGDHISFLEIKNWMNEKNNNLVT